MDRRPGMHFNVVYNRRVSSEFKSGLQPQVRLRKVSVSSIVNPEATEQRKLHREAASCFGTLAGHNRSRAETARESIRQRLGRRYFR